MDFLIKFGGAVLIVLVIRWMLQEKQSEMPITRGNSKIYAVRPKLKLIANIGNLFLIGLIAWIWESANTQELYLIVFPIGFFFVGIWLGYGRVITDTQQITHEEIGRRKTLHWKAIEYVSVYPARGGEIKLGSRSESILVDYRIVAKPVLLNEILEQTNISAQYIET